MPIYFKTLFFGGFFLMRCRFWPKIGHLNFPFQTVKISLFKLSKFPFSNCQNFSFQTVKISFSNCQNFSFQTVKNFLFKLSKFPFSNCQNFSFQTVKNFLFKLLKFQTVTWMVKITERNQQKVTKCLGLFNIFEAKWVYFLGWTWPDFPRFSS
jgi:hypothetical protein